MENFKERFQNIGVYHLYSILPLVLIVAPYIYKYIGTLWFLVLMFPYTFIYRVWLDKQRLKALNLYNGEGYWKFFWVTRFKNYGRLMFE